jgi:hypothetical protein
MNQNEIKNLATIAFAKCDHIPNTKIPKEFVLDFAKLVAAKEREACAKVADYYASGMDRNYSEIIADAIRARGEA